LNGAWNKAWNEAWNEMSISDMSDLTALRCIADKNCGACPDDGEYNKCVQQCTAVKGGTRYTRERLDGTKSLLRHSDSEIRTQLERYSLSRPSGYYGILKSKYDEFTYSDLVTMISPRPMNHLSIIDDKDLPTLLKLGEFLLVDILRSKVVVEMSVDARDRLSQIQTQLERYSLSRPSGYYGMLKSKYDKFTYSDLVTMISPRPMKHLSIIDDEVLKKTLDEFLLVDLLESKVVVEMSDRARRRLFHVGAATVCRRQLLHTASSEARRHRCVRAVYVGTYGEGVFTPEWRVVPGPYSDRFEAWLTAADAPCIKIEWADRCLQLGKAQYTWYESIRSLYPHNEVWGDGPHLLMNMVHDLSVSDCVRRVPSGGSASSLRQTTPIPRRTSLMM
jgi:hypothetical protein